MWRESREVSWHFFFQGAWEVIRDRDRRIQLEQTRQERFEHRIQHASLARVVANHHVALVPVDLLDPIHAQAYSRKTLRNEHVQSSEP